MILSQKNIEFFKDYYNFTLLRHINRAKIRPFLRKTQLTKLYFAYTVNLKLGKLLYMICPVILVPKLMRNRLFFHLKQISYEF